MSRSQLVTGAGGQDGILLCRVLLARGLPVVATTLTGSRPDALEDAAGLEVAALDVRDTDAFEELVRSHDPAVIHHLAAQSSVRASWEDPGATREVNQVAVEEILRRLATGASTARFVLASSSEVFGPVQGGVASPRTPLRPVNPYGEAKAAAHRAVAEARAHGVPATNLILFGHTSELHEQGFVLPTIVAQAVEVAHGDRETIELQDPSVARDWGSAHDYVRAFVRAADGPPGDYVVATGELHRLSEIAAWALAACGADPVRVSSRSRASARANDYGEVRGDASGTAEALGWRPERSLRDEIESMVRFRLAAG